MPSGSKQSRLVDGKDLFCITWAIPAGILQRPFVSLSASWAGRIAIYRSAAVCNIFDYDNDERPSGRWEGEHNAENIRCA